MSREESLDAMMKYEKGVSALKKPYKEHAKEKKEHMAKKMGIPKGDLIPWMHKVRKGKREVL